MTLDKLETRDVHLSVPDTRRENVAEECRRQARVIAAHDSAESDVLAWLDAVRDTDGWT